MSNKEQHAAHPSPGGTILYRRGCKPPVLNYHQFSAVGATLSHISIKQLQVEMNRWDYMGVIMLPTGQSP